MNEQNDNSTFREGRNQNLSRDERLLDCNEIAELVATFCGLEKTLVLGALSSCLVSELVKKGVDAYGLQSNDVPFATQFDGCAGRVKRSSLIDARQGANSFNTLVSLNHLESLAPETISRFLSEMHKVVSRYVFLKIDITPVSEGLHENINYRDRAWWERHCFEAGFRKSPTYYRVNSYESLNKEGAYIYILLEKIPDIALVDYSLSSLAEERDLHMDMMREVGERSDAHIARYQWASDYVRPGDRVLDAACGLGYGGYVITQLTEASSVLGIDGSGYAIDYANKSFTTIEQRTKYIEGYLPQALSVYEDGYFDTIISFETLEHVEDPIALLAEFSRVLSPGGRIITSVPNDWSDETGEDPNPFHLHVYTWEKLKSQLSQEFNLEHAFQQIASGCKIASRGNKWESRPRTFRQVNIATKNPPDSEWWLMVGIKDPVNESQPYRETIYGYTRPPKNALEFQRDYNNPWLLRSLVEFQFRAKETSVLQRFADRVLLKEQSSGSPDEGAALAVIGYKVFGDDKSTGQAIQEMITALTEYTQRPPKNPHELRWHISLSFLMAMLQKKVGLLHEARQKLEELAFTDCLPFSPTLGTKIVDAAYEGGLLSAALGDIPKARKLWQQGVREALRLLRSPEEELVGDIEYPHQFSLIVAVEFLDSATRCVKALRWTKDGRGLPLSRLYEESRQCWKWMLAGRTEAIHSQAKMINERDAVLNVQAAKLNAQESNLSDMTFMIGELIKASESQTRIIEERWEIMQQMEAVIANRDDRIKSLRSRLDEVNSVNGAFRHLAKIISGKLKFIVSKS